MSQSGQHIGGEFCWSPQDAVSEPATGLHAQGVDSPARLCLLIVDDYADAAYSFAHLLSFMGHEVYVCRTADEALDAVSSLRPDVAFLDLKLPQMDGYELARRLREVPGLEETTLIAVTGVGGAEAFRMSRDAGFAQHLLKPVEPDELLMILAELVQEKASSHPRLKGALAEDSSPDGEP
jgi:CheY-like chemotaxis protein